MAQSNFAYSAAANDPAGLPLALSVFADRAHLRDEMRDDAELAGFRIAEVGGIDMGNPLGREDAHQVVFQR